MPKAYWTTPLPDLTICDDTVRMRKTKRERERRVKAAQVIHIIKLEHHTTGNLGRQNVEFNSTTYFKALIKIIICLYSSQNGNKT